MDLNQLSFHHVGIACRDIVKTMAFYRGMGYSASAIVDDPLQHVRICFLDKEGAPRLELLEPLDEQNPLVRTLDAVGVSPYHFCYSVSNIEDAVAALRAERFLLVNGPVPACAMNDRRIAFLYHKNFGLIELVEMEP